MRAAKILIVALLVGVFVPAGTEAGAVCHAFTVSVTPERVDEGRYVTVVVQRDGASSDSQVDVGTLPGSASADSDYQSAYRTISFTGSDVRQQFQVATIADGVPENDETFSLHLSNPAGCGGSGYYLGPDARVTIRDVDTPAATPTPAPAATPAPAPVRTTARPARKPAATTTVAPTPAATSAAAATPPPLMSSTPTFADRPIPVSTPENASPTSDARRRGLIVLGFILGGLAAGAAGAVWVQRRMRRRP